MNWTTPGDLKLQLTRLWERGQLPRMLISGAEGFPLRLRLRGPDSQELTDQFEAVRAWCAALAAMPLLRLRWKEIRHRVHGSQRLPEAVWIDAPEQAVALLGKRRDAEQLIALAALTRQRLPMLLSWLEQHPLRALDLAEAWPRLLSVVDWVVGHPRPGIYLRQTDIPGVHSKFIETHRAVLCQLLDLALPGAAVDPRHTGVGGFARRYGFRDKPVRIRLRLLDESVTVLPGVPCPDLTLDATSFAALRPAVRHVFITENETNFLAFPAASRSLVVFGAGYGWDALAQAAWVATCRIHYWGDIDCHGFAILDQLRSHFPTTASFLMDRATLLAHQSHWGEEPDPVRHALPRLTADEAKLFDELRSNRIRPNLRLEQERIAFGWVTAAIGRILDDQKAAE